MAHKITKNIITHQHRNMCISAPRRVKARPVRLSTSSQAALPSWLLDDQEASAIISDDREDVSIGPQKAIRRDGHIIVQHQYHDHGDETDPSPLLENNKPGANTQFPLKLHRMLEQVEQDGASDIISWQPHNRCFVVHKPEMFKELLPRYFNVTKISSFQRQLNLYGFQRITTGRDKNGYYHELFLRDRSGMASRITRVKVKGTGVRGRSNPAQEPDFWNMPWITVGKPNQIPSKQVLPKSDASALVQKSSDHNIGSNAKPQRLPEMSCSPAADLILSLWDSPFQVVEDSEVSAISLDDIIMDDNSLDKLVQDLLAFDESGDNDFATMLERITSS